MRTENADRRNLSDGSRVGAGSTRSAASSGRRKIAVVAADRAAGASGVRLRTSGHYRHIL